MSNTRILSQSRQDRESREQRRIRAASLFKNGHTQADVARRLKVSPEAVREWHAAWETGGVSALKSKGKPGPKPTLTPRNITRIERALMKGPLAHGYHTELWTLERIRHVIKDATGHSYGTTHTWRILTSILGWSSQKPETRAKERNGKGIQRWVRHTWPQVKGGREKWARA